MMDAEQYFQNTDDIINEEDLEESIYDSRLHSPLREMSEQRPPNDIPKVQQKEQKEVNEQKVISQKENP